MFFISRGATAHIDPRPPHCWGIQITHTYTHSVGILWTSDQYVAGAAKYTTHKHKRQKSTISGGGFESVTPAITGVNIFKFYTQ